MCACFHDRDGGKIGSRFLGLEHITEASSEVLFAAIAKLLQKYEISWSSCVGFVSDDPSSFVARTNSVWTRIQDVAQFPYAHE